MIKKLVALAVLSLAFQVSGAFAHTAAPKTSAGLTRSNVERIDALYRGEGKPGDTVRSVSNPDVVFRVTPRGSIERRNERYGYSDTRRPRSIFWKDYQYRGGK